MESVGKNFLRMANESGIEPATVPEKFDSYDVSVVVVYFILVLATGFYSMYVSNRSTVSGYFLAGRFMCWLPVGASLFASNIGSEHFIGLAGSGAASGIGVAAFELNALPILQMTGWIFLPVYIASRVCTLPEYMTKRFGGQRIRTYLAVLSMLLYIFTKISVNLFSGAVFINQALHWDIYLSILGLLLLTGLCTITGGLTAVIYTDTLQFFVMMVGGIVVAIKAIDRIGGMSALQEKYMEAIPAIRPNGTTCGIPKEDSWVMMRSWDDPDMPWLGFLLGQTPASIWYWCTDQMMVQRLLAAKSLSHAQGGTLFAGFMKILPMFLVVMPGMISRVLFTEEVACADPDVCMQYCQNPAGCSNIAYPRLVLELMPSGLRGLMMAVMLAAIMSNLTSVYNSASTLFTMDIWPQIRKKATVTELMIVGRVFIVIMIIISISWVPAIQNLQGGQLFIYINSVSAYLAPPIAAVYLLAIFWRRMNESGCFWGMILGFMVGMSRMALDFIYAEPRCDEIDTRPLIVRKVHYFYFGFFLFALTIVTSAIVSLMTEPTEKFRLIRTTYWTRFDEFDRKDDQNSFEMSANSTPEKKTLQNNDTKEKATDVEAMKQQSQQEEDKSMLFLLRKWTNWFCGISQKSQDPNERTNEQLDEVPSLAQSMRDKIILNSLLVVALFVSTFTFLYYSNVFVNI